MNKTYYVCKYTPIELLTALGAECENLNGMQEGFDRADQMAHSNICGFGKSLLEAVMSGQVRELVLVNCCDTIRSVYDVLAESGKLDFLYIVDMLHSGGECSRQRTAAHPGLDGRPAAADDGPGYGGQLRALVAEGHPGKDGIGDAVFGTHVGVELNGDQNDDVAQDDVDDRQHGGDAQGHQGGGQSQRGNGHGQAQPEVRDILGSPGTL